MAGHPTYDLMKMRDYMDRRVTPPKRVTSPTWGPPPPCKQALKLSSVSAHWAYLFSGALVREARAAEHHG